MMEKRYFNLSTLGICSKGLTTALINFLIFEQIHFLQMKAVCYVYLFSHCLCLTLKAFEKLDPLGLYLLQHTIYSQTFKWLFIFGVSLYGDVANEHL